MRWRQSWKASLQGRAGGDRDRLGQRFHGLAHGQCLEVEHAIDHEALFGGQGLGGFLHDQAQLFAVAEKIAGEGLAAAPAQQDARYRFDQGHQGTEQEVHDPKGPRHEDAEPVRIGAEEHLWQQIEEGVEEQNDGRKDDDKDEEMTGQLPVEDRHQPAQDQEVGQSVAHQDGPEKILGIFQVMVEDLGGGESGAHPLANAQSAQGKHPRLHAREEKRHRQADDEDEPDEGGAAHIT